MRLRELARWRVRSRELDQAERDLHAGLRADVRGSVGRKRLLLLREMLMESGFPCAERVFESMSRRFSVLGPIEATGVFPAYAPKIAILR